MRGKPAIPVDLCVILWLIPAYAGKTRIWRSAAWKTTAHPRVCGENLAKYTPGRRSAGSSPRMRGKPGSSPVGGTTTGLIPAYAGKTGRAEKRGSLRGAHPRVCGENRVLLPHRRGLPGSSPRMRGKRPGIGSGQAVEGLIPAYAGKTLGHHIRPRLFPAHPRVCGENRPPLAHRKLKPGSSPRMRGKQRLNKRNKWNRRLIPAYAGKTVRGYPTSGAEWAHPRVCGENTERSGVLTLRSVRSWKTLSFPSSLKVTHCRAFVQLSLSRIRL